MDRRLFRSLVLILALLAGQWSGIFHVSGHHASEGDQPHAACELCAAHAMWDHGLAAAVPAVPAVVSLPGQAPAPATGRRHADLPPFHSRAPPFPV